MKRILIEVAGWFFIVLGVIGFFVPVLQGLLFVLIGLTLLSTQHDWARRWIIRLRHRFPRIDRQLQRLLGKHARHIPGEHSPPAGE
jgi:uncharacterized membrane protein YbaN (DUF454 family)